MFTTLMHVWEHVARLLIAYLHQWLPDNPGLYAAIEVLALLWPFLLAMAILCAIVGVGTWLDRRDMARRLNQRLAQLRAELDDEGANE